MSEVRSIGDIAKRAGVSVRTLRFYEQKGLLTSIRSAGGQRHYGVGQVQRLQEILLLKSVGLKLEDIASLFARGDVEAGTFLDLQMAALSEQKQRIDTVMMQLGAAKAAIGAGQSLDISSLCDLIKSTGRLKMELDWKEVVEKYYTEEQLADLAKRAPTPEEQEQISAKWTALMAKMDALAEAGADPASAEAQEAAREWQGLIDAFTGGDPGIAQSLKRMYDDQANWPKQPMPREHFEPPKKSAEFIQKALAILKEN